MIETDNYYRRRIEEELAAAARSEDPSISQIHLEMARRYREILGSEADEPDADAILIEPRAGLIAGSGAVFG